MQLKNRASMLGIATRLTTASVLTAISVGFPAGGAHAQTLPVTPAQQVTAQQVAQKGVPMGELASNAPDLYVVKRGDTLWGISGMYLKRPWRWPELWGMNMQQIRNPHRIYPGQKLYLERKDGYATLSTNKGGKDTRAGTGEPETIRVSPRTRFESITDAMLPTLQPHMVEPFLTEPLIVDENTLAQAPRVVATREDRVIMSQGDRAYARSASGMELSAAPGISRSFRIFRNATPLKDPITGNILGYEAEYVGQATLVRGESSEDTLDSAGVVTGTVPIPATIDITATKQEVRAGDRLLPEPERQITNYAPRAPSQPIDARVVSIYGSAVANAAQNQVITINLGAQDGIEAGHVLALMTGGRQMLDHTDAARGGAQIQLPDERNGLLMVFRAFDRVSYGLILGIDTGVRVGDRVTNPN